MFTNSVGCSYCLGSVDNTGWRFSELLSHEEWLSLGFFFGGLVKVSAKSMICFWRSLR